MFSHGLKMDGAPSAVVPNDRRWHVQHFWNWRVEFPHEIDVSGNALHLALYLSCFATTYVVRLNLSSATNGGNWTGREENNVGCNHVKHFAFSIIALTLYFQQRLITFAFTFGVATNACVVTHLRPFNVRYHQALIWNYDAVVEGVRQVFVLVNEAWLNPAD